MGVCRTPALATCGEVPVTSPIVSTSNYSLKNSLFSSPQPACFRRVHITRHVTKSCAAGDEVLDAAQDGLHELTPQTHRRSRGGGSRRSSAAHGRQGRNHAANSVVTGPGGTAQSRMLGSSREPGSRSTHGCTIGGQGGSGSRRTRSARRISSSGSIARCTSRCSAASVSSNIAW